MKGSQCPYTLCHQPDICICTDWLWWLLWFCFSKDIRWKIAPIATISISVGNPIYLRGVQVLDLEPSDALNATQDSYQPLVENTREPGASEDYRSLENEEGCDERNAVFVDQTGYEGLARSQTHKYQSLAKVGKKKVLCCSNRIMAFSNMY